MRVLPFLVAAAFALPTAAQATCPATLPIIDQLSCSSSIGSLVDHTQTSLLGGDCETGDCYSCGEPWANQSQIAPEAVYTFTCQVSGSVRLLVSNLPCDLDIYVLDSSCDPNTGCVQGSTASYNVDDEVEFTCTQGETYYVVVEAYGTDHLDIASGPCTDAAGNVYSPAYTLSFDVSESTGCPEDCNDGLDNDLDGVTDCADPDCGADAVCCDLDHDFVFGAQCGGDDCDDGDDTVLPGAPEDGGAGTDLGDGLDNDCDGDIDEGMLDTDDDGDGETELDGDCDDTDPSVHSHAPEDGGAGTQLGDGLDNDCDGDIDEDMLDTDDDGDGKSEVDGDCDDGDATIYPGAPEVIGNGIDEDCDGADDEPPGDDDDTTAGDDDDDDTTAGDDDTTAEGDDDDTAGMPIPGDDDELPETTACSCSHSSPRGSAAFGLLALVMGAARRRR